MKKLIRIIGIFCLLAGCQAAAPEQQLVDTTSAGKILFSYLSVQQPDNPLLSRFSDCKLEYTQSKPKKRNAQEIGAYVCTVTTGTEQEDILVISDAPQLKNEINPSKKNRKDLVYIAHLTHDKKNNLLFGTKTLFNVQKNTVLESSEVNEAK